MVVLSLIQHKISFAWSIFTYLTNPLSLNKIKTTYPHKRTRRGPCRYARSVSSRTGMASWPVRTAELFSHLLEEPKRLMDSNVATWNGSAVLEGLSFNRPGLLP
jgi:hypothetical protein